MKAKNLSGVPFIALFLLLLIGQGQTQAGTFRGEVKDSEGNSVEGVEIVIQRLGFKQEFKLKTNKQGYYVHGGIPRGTYRVIAIKKGFQPASVEGVRAQDNLNPSEGLVDFVLKRGKGNADVFQLTDLERERLREEREERENLMDAVKESFNAGILFFQYGRYEQAAGAFKEAAERDENQPLIWAHLGKTYRELKQYDEAVEAYNRAILLKPEDPFFYQSVARIYLDSGQAEMAEESYRKAANLTADTNPKEAATNYYNMGVIHINGGRNTKAMEAMKKALEIDPDMALAHYQLGITLISANEVEQALVHLKQCVELAPSHPNTEVAKALIEQLGGAIRGKNL